MFRSSSKKYWHNAQSGERGMSENGSESLPFEPPEQENVRLREENARLRRLLAYVSSKDRERYRALIERLGLRDTLNSRR